MPNENIRLYLSGGSHRSSLGSIGAIMFLVMNRPSGQYHWSDVDEVIGVSGGSQPIAAMMASLARKGAPNAADDPDSKPIKDTDYLHTVQSMRSLYKALLDENGEHWKAFRRRRFVTWILMLAFLPIAAFVVLFAFPGFIAFPIGLIMIPIVYRFGSRLLHSYLKDVLSSFIEAPHEGHKKSMTELAKSGKDRFPRRNYYIGTAGLGTGYNYFYWAGQGFGTNPDGSINPEGIPDGVPRSTSNPVDAIVASSSLPPLSRRGKPPIREQKLDKNGQPHLVNGVPKAKLIPESAPKNEPLLDGGYGGNFGVQITQKILQDTASGKPTHNRRVIALDAGRRLQPPGFWVRVVRVLSTVVRLIRVIEVSVGATYTNDIQDLEDVDGSIIAVSRVDGYNTSSTKPLSDEDKIRNRLCQAVELNGQLGLTNLKHPTAEIAVIVGVVGMYLAEVDRRKIVDPTKSDHADIHELDSLLEAIGTALGTSPFHTPWAETNIAKLHDDYVEKQKKNDKDFVSVCA